MTNGDWMHAYTFANDSLTSARDRIRELEAELAVRDNMGDEVLELVAWAEGEQIEIHKTMNGVQVILGWGPMEFHGDTMIDTLRRAKEASTS